MAASRWIVVDDTDLTALQYSSSWFPVNSQGNQDAIGNFGPAYRSTLHGTNLNATLSFNFTGESMLRQLSHVNDITIQTYIGSQIRVWGSNNPSQSLLSTTGVMDPSWECFVDGNSIGSNALLPFPENNYIFCMNLHFLTAHMSLL